MMNAIRMVRTVAFASFQDWIRERLLYNLFFVSVFLIFFGYLAALLVYGHQDRVMLHFGMLVNAFSIFGVSASAGVRSIRNDLDQRTAYLTLTRPLSRVWYYLGKWKGISLFTLLNHLLLMGVLIVALRVVDGRVTLAFYQASSLILIEAFLVSAVALFLSLMLRPALATMGTLAYLFIGHNHEQLALLNSKGSGNGLFSLLSALTPDAGVLLMDTRVYYENPLSSGEWCLRGAYGLGWALLFLILGNAWFYRKNL